MASAPQMSEACSKAFRDAAKLYSVYILVRRTNLKSLRYIGDPGCIAKRLDCKAKTAQNDYQHPRFGFKKVAGLVVDPTLTGRDAFDGPKKYDAATREWAKFTSMLDPAISTLEGQRRLTYVPNGKFYFVDLDPASARYGCVKFSSNSLMTAGKYIHGDFDLYGIVPADGSVPQYRGQREAIGSAPRAQSRILRCAKLRQPKDRRAHGAARGAGELWR